MFFCCKSQLDEVLSVGTLCKNPGCQKAYQSEESNFETCEHHTGVPVFHEGLKFWSCCQKRTSDFSTFLNQSGCSSGKHLWIKPKTEESVENIENTCRFDWFQFGPNVVLTIYSKNPIPDISVVSANQVKLQVSITFGAEHKRFVKCFNLFETIDLSRSQVVYSPVKTEITMKKVDFIQWPSLELNGTYWFWIKNQL